MPESRRWASLLFWLAMSAVVAAVGARFAPGQWYIGLAKPAWTPPNWLFPPVWTALYIAMAVAIWRVEPVAGRQHLPRILYLLQLLLNGLWSWLFFGLHWPVWALADILALLLVLIATTRVFWRLDAVAGWLMVAYTAWVGYASTLNGAIVYLNP